MTRFDLASARAAAAAGRTAVWVGDFLASRGSDNGALAAALAQKRHWWVGPIRVRLDDLVRLAGPEEDALVRVADEEWEDDVEEMHESLDHGWEPPPLLAEYQAGRLLLQDGNHRYEALTRARGPDAWVLVFFEDPVERDRFVAREHEARESD
ncbi:MAG: hypothetical protein M3Q30_22505 [Actinomycetota bacterium]|nr:hypothetical protein [Actinomycetota bacterium]